MKESILIAKFLGWEVYPDGETLKVPNLYPIYNIDDDENTGWISENYKNLDFHTRWDWLMPVIEKISRQELKYRNSEETYNPYPRTFGMINDEGKFMFRFNVDQLFIEEQLIDAAYQAVIYFLKNQ